jgi:type II secretory pathway pseudopilin PulG
VQDEPQAPETQDTPETEAPPEGTRAPEQESTIDWEKRYNDLRPQWDRANAELSQLRSRSELASALESDDHRADAIRHIAQTYGPEAVLEALGYAVEGDETEGQDEEFRDPRVDQLLAQQQAQEQEKQLDALERTIEGEIDNLAKQHSLELTDHAKSLIFNQTLALAPLDGNQPDVKQAFEMLTGLRDEWIKGYRESKRAPAPPQTGGSSGEPAHQLGDSGSRIDRALQVANEAFAGED